MSAQGAQGAQRQAALSLAPSRMKRIVPAVLSAEVYVHVISEAQELQMTAGELVGQLVADVLGAHGTEGGLPSYGLPPGFWGRVTRAQKLTAPAPALRGEVTPQRLATARRELGLSQAQAARYCGLKRSGYQGVEAGTRVQQLPHCVAALEHLVVQKRSLVAALDAGVHAGGAA